MAPATFRRLKNYVLRGYIGKFVLEDKYWYSPQRGRTVNTTLKVIGKAEMALTNMLKKIGIP